MHLPVGDSELIQIMDAELADAARRAGEWLVCKPGCSQCCTGSFAINALDAERLRVGMERLWNEQPKLAAEVEQRAVAWMTKHGADFPGDVQTGLLGDSDAERERFEGFANDSNCPALDAATGQCDLYASRPMTCRVFGPPVRMGSGDELGCCELCFKGASEEEIASCEMQLPHNLEDSLLEEIPSHGETVVAFALLG